MATPEQNTLLALQLMSPAADQFNRQNNQRTALLLDLINRNREEKLKRDLATQSYDRAVQIANLQGDREDARANSTFKREGQRLEALQTREDARVAGAETRQGKALDAADKKQLRNAIATAYPKYAAEATRLGEKVRAITDFEESWEGLGDLQAELGRLEVARVQRDQHDASTAAVGELDDATKAVQEHQNALKAAMKPSPDDEKFARARAVDQVRQAIEAGGLTAAPKPNSKAAKDGLNALLKGDEAIATQLLGAEVMGTFGLAFESAMQAAPNFKGRMQQLSIAQKNYELAQRSLQTIQSDLRRAAPGNNSLAKMLTERRGNLQQLMGPLDDGSAGGGGSENSFQRFTPPRGGGGSGGGTGAPVGAAGAGASPTYKYPALSILGLGERAGSAQDFAAAPGNILMAPARMVDSGAQALGAGMRGIFTGDYSLPPSVIQSGAAALGSALPTGATDEEQVAKIQNEISALTPGAGQADTAARIRYLQRLLQSYNRPTESLLAPAGY